MPWEPETAPTPAPVNQLDELIERLSRIEAKLEALTASRIIETRIVVEPAKAMTRRELLGALAQTLHL